jgi:hypothetical protein
MSGDDDIKDLVEAARSFEQQEPLTLFDKFVIENNIRPGEFKVYAYELYYKYVKWLTSKGVKDIPHLLRAFRGVKTDIPKRADNDRGIAYFTNKDSLWLTKEEREEALKMLWSFQKKSKQKKEQALKRKKQREIKRSIRASNQNSSAE